MRRNRPWYQTVSGFFEPGNLGFSVVDKFLIVAPAPKEQVQTQDGVTNLAELLQMFRSEYEVVLDFTRPGLVYRDYADLLEMLGVERTPVLTSPESFTSAIRLPFYNTRFLHLRSSSVPWQHTRLSARIFQAPAYVTRDPHEDLDRKLATFADHVQEDEKRIDWKGSPQGIRQKIRNGQVDCNQLARWRLLRHIFGRVAVNSLLTEFALQATGDELVLAPYHQHACYDIKQPGENLVLARPSAVANRTGLLLAPEIRHFVEVVNRRGVSERDIQICLQQNPRLLKTLGYSKVVPHVVLERVGGDPLIPDFFLQPIGSEFWDILDIKLPNVKTHVGTKNRMRYSADIAEVASQLREYGAYFDDPALADRIEQACGIRCYKPKLIALVGRQEDVSDVRQARRLKSQYSDVEIMTFDRLVAFAKERMLL